MDVIFQSFRPSYDPFIVNYNMNRLEKSIHELINILVQYDATTHKSELVVLVVETSTSKVKRKGARCWKRKKGKGTAVTGTASTGGALAAPTVKGKGKVGGSHRSRANDVCMHCYGKGHWKRECSQLLSNPGMLDTGCGAHICNNLQVLERSRKLSKDEMVLRLGDGKAVAAKAHLLGTLMNGVYILQHSNMIMTAQHKHKGDDHKNAQIWHARLGHISKKG
ncbi:UNVERIFIED_CONTAM: hypothetical protein Sradi_6905100 [Sesamum radiatum]|uniref:CCHC-type domain-containing protein n=1 Tax=Sesamum radiatum TaxID=300843 RepID=A0AAW2JI63_SESRA